MVARIAIDPNVRVRGNQTFAGLEDVQGGDVVAGGRVEVYEPESGLTGPGEVIEVDRERGLVYLEVDWGALHEAASAPTSALDVLRQRVWPWLKRIYEELARSARTTKYQRHR
ncbi:MAG TPA: hypothetical protein VMA73_01270 [Streptosporangiaceae bacterium]|nr:hypothetical protein [Streptosporangiaceae bacterium]